LFSFVDDRSLDGLDANAIQLGVAIACQRIDMALWIEGHGDVAKFHLEETGGHPCIRWIEPDHLIEPAPDRGIERLIEIGGSDKEALGLNTIDEDQQAVDGTAQLVVLTAIFFISSPRTINPYQPFLMPTT